MPASYTWDVYVNDTCTGANEKSTWISHSIKYKSTTCQVRISSLRRKPSQNTGPLIFRESFSLFYQTKSKCLELQQFFRVGRHFVVHEPFANQIRRSIGWATKATPRKYDWRTALESSLPLSLFRILEVWVTVFGNFNSRCDVITFLWCLCSPIFRPRASECDCFGSCRQMCHLLIKPGRARLVCTSQWQAYL